MRTALWAGPLLLVAFALSLGLLLLADNAFASHPRPLGASKVRAPLVPAFQNCTDPNSSHGPPLGFGSCTPPTQESPLLTTSRTGKGLGSVSLRVFYCPMCDSIFNEEVFISVQMTDVRKADGSDYAGELEANIPVRVTDHRNKNVDGTPTAAGTVVDFPLRFAVPCSETEDTSIGSTCNVDTSLTALYGFDVISDGDRGVWELGTLEMLDGGSDGLASTHAGNLPFVRQGVFAP